VFVILFVVFVCWFIADGRTTAVVASSESVPSAEIVLEGAEQQLTEESTMDSRVNELWMDFDVLCKCFRSDTLQHVKHGHVLVVTGLACVSPV